MRYCKTKRECILAHQEYLVKLKETVGKCVCGKSNFLTLDHIIPLQLLKEMGFDVDRFFDEGNLQIQCKACNYIKGNHLIFANPRTEELLRLYLDIM